MIRPIGLAGLLFALAIFSLGMAGVGRPGPRPGSPVPTYAADIAPILNKQCVECHRPGEVAPFSLIGYENAKKWAPMISLVTASKRMPPWKAVHGFGEFKDERILSEAELASINQWADAGAPRGDKSMEPAPPKFASEWVLGEPDLVVQPAKAFSLGAEGNDVYRNFVIKTTYAETKWVRAIDVRPGNPKVVHHVIAFLDYGSRAQGLESRTRDGEAGYASGGGGIGFPPDGSFGGWAPGVRPRTSAGDVAFELKPGGTIVMQVHYHKSGKPETDRTRIGLYFSPKKPERVLKLAWLANPLFRLEAGKKDQEVKLRLPIPADITLYALMPHMHQLGRTMKATAELPDGSVKPLIWINDWDFNWQLTYPLKEPLRLPKGTIVNIEATYDNSADNPRNPNSPPKPVTWGEQTSDEMFLLVAAYTTDDNQGFDDRAAIIKALFGGKG